MELVIMKYKSIWVYCLLFFPFVAFANASELANKGWDNSESTTVDFLKTQCRKVSEHVPLGWEGYMNLEFVYNHNREAMPDGEEIEVIHEYDLSAFAYPASGAVREVILHRGEHGFYVKNTSRAPLAFTAILALKTFDGDSFLREYVCLLTPGSDVTLNGDSSVQRNYMAGGVYPLIAETALISTEFNELAYYKNTVVVQ